MLFLWRQVFNCVGEFVWKPIGSSGTGAYHDEGGAKLGDEKSKTTTKTTLNVIGQLKPKLRISPATATAMTKLTNQAIPRQSIGMWTPLECGLALPAV